MAYLSRVKHPAFIGIQRPTHEAGTVAGEGRLEIGIIFGLGAAQDKAFGLKNGNGRHYAASPKWR